MAADMVVFAVMSYFYVYVEKVDYEDRERNDGQESGSDDGPRLTEIAATDNKVPDENTKF